MLGGIYKVKKETQLNVPGCLCLINKCLENNELQFLQFKFNMLITSYTEIELTYNSNSNSNKFKFKFKF